MEKPILRLNGMEYEPKRPTMRTWRTIAEHDAADMEGLSIKDILSNRVGVIALIYGLEKEAVEEGIDVADVIPAYNAAAKWVLGLVFEKLEQLPNGEAGEGA